MKIKIGSTIEDEAYGSGTILRVYGGLALVKYDEGGKNDVPAMDEIPLENLEENS